MSALLRGAFPGSRLDISGEGAKWNLLFPRGEWHGANLAPIGGSIVIDDAMLSEMVANWRAAGSPPLPVRKTHLHLDEDVPAVDRPELQKSYGLLTDFRVTPAGLEALTDWTEEGRACVRAGEFNFWSPEWNPRHVDRRTGETKGWWVSGTALTNDPFFNSMPRVAASSHAAPTHSNPIKENSMNPELKKRMKMALKCSEDCTDEELVAAVEKSGSATASSIPTAEVITAAVAPVKAEVDTLRAELKKRDAAILERDVDALVATAKQGDSKSGRAINDVLVATAKKIAVSEGLTAAKSFLEALPLSVPLKATGVTGDVDTVLSAEAAAKKLNARAAELRAANVKNPTEVAINEMPEVAAIAQGRVIATLGKE